MVYKFFDKKSAGSGVNTHSNNECPLELKILFFFNLENKQFIQDSKTTFGVLI